MWSPFTHSLTHSCLQPPWQPEERGGTLHLYVGQAVSICVMCVRVYIYIYIHVCVCVCGGGGDCVCICGILCMHLYMRACVCVYGRCLCACSLHLHCRALILLRFPSINTWKAGRILFNFPCNEHIIDRTVGGALSTQTQHNPKRKVKRQMDRMILTTENGSNFCVQLSYCCFNSLLH